MRSMDRAGDFAIINDVQRVVSHISRYRDRTFRLAVAAQGGEDRHGSVAASAAH
jgi:hypothetical protein